MTKGRSKIHLITSALSDMGITSDHLQKQHKIPVDAEKLLFKERHYIVYLLWLNDEIVYAGRTTQAIKERIKGHLREGMKEFDAYTYVEIPSDQMNDTEKYLIHRLQPKYNKFGKDIQLFVEIENKS